MGRLYPPDPLPLGHAQYHVASPSRQRVQSNNAPAPPEVSSTQRRHHTDPLSLPSRIRSYPLDQVSDHTQPESPPRIPNKTTYIAVPQILVIHNTFVFPKYDTLLWPVAPHLSTICLLAVVYKFRILSLSLPGCTTHHKSQVRLLVKEHSPLQNPSITLCRCCSPHQVCAHTTAFHVPISRPSQIHIQMHIWIRHPGSR